MRFLTTLFLAVALTFLAKPSAAQATAQESLMAGQAAVSDERWIEAEALFQSAYDAAAGAARDTIAFWQGFAAYKQGETIARSNTAGRVEVAGAAHDHFVRALLFIQESAHPQRRAVENAIGRYIENQRRIMEVGVPSPR
jgi:hypothetical protein